MQSLRPISRDKSISSPYTYKRHYIRHAQLQRPRVAAVTKKAKKPEHYIIRLSKEELVNGFHAEYSSSTARKLVATIDFIDDQLMVQGHSQDFRIVVDAPLDLVKIQLCSPGANVQLDVPVMTERPFSLIADANNVSILNSMQTKSSFKIYVTGKLTLNNLLIAQEDAYVHANTLDGLKGGLYATNELTLNAKTLQLEKECLVGANKNVVIHVDNIKHLRGKIMSGNEMSLDITRDIYCSREGQIAVNNKLDLSCQNMMLTDNAIIDFARDANLTITNKLTIDKKARLGLAKGLTALKIEVDTLTNYHCIRADKIAIHAKNELINRKAAVIKAGKKLILTGDSVWNAGELLYGKEAFISLNKYFMHGLSSQDELYGLPKNRDDMLPRPLIKGDGNLTVIAGLIVTAAALVEVGNVTAASLLDVNPLSVTERIFENKASLIDVDVGLTIPNFPLLFKSLQEAMEKISHGEFEQVLKGVFTIESLLLVLNLALSLLKLFLPVIKKPVDMAWHLLLLIANAKPLCEYIVMLVKQSRSIELRDVLPLLLFTKNMVTTSLELFELSQVNLHGESHSLAHESGAETITQKELLEAAVDLFSVVSPSTESSSLLHLRAGLHANVTLRDHALMPMNVGDIQLGAKVSRLGLFTPSPLRSLDKMNLAYESSSSRHDEANKMLYQIDCNEDEVARLARKTGKKK